MKTLTSGPPLPKDAETMKQLIGIKAAMAICKEYGGRRLYMPKKAHADHKLAALIGLENLEKLATHYLGERITIPKCAMAKKHLRNQKIIAACGPVSISKLAKLHDLGEVMIQRIVTSENKTRKGN